jgi:hypothetical protein
VHAKKKKKRVDGARGTHQHGNIAHDAGQVDHSPHAAVEGIYKRLSDSVDV